MSDPKPTILVVDDEPSIRGSLVEFYNAEGFNVDEASNGEEALAKINEKKFSLVVLDIKMPVLDGVGTVRKLNEIAEKPPIIMMSAFKIPNEAFLMGVRVCIYKPLHFDDLLALTHELIEASKKGEDVREVMACIKCQKIIRTGEGRYVLPEGDFCSGCYKKAA